MYMLSSLAQEKRTQQEGLTVRYTRGSLGCLHNSDNGVTVRAYGLSPLKLQSRSTSKSGLLLLIHI